MKFDCQRPIDLAFAPFYALNRWLDRQSEKFSSALRERDRKRRAWRKVFAIIPRKVGYRDCRWFEYIEKRESRDYHFSFLFEMGSYKWSSEYRALDEQPK